MLGLLNPRRRAWRTTKRLGEKADGAYYSTTSASELQYCLLQHVNTSFAMNKDGCYTSVHMHQPRNADLFEDVCKDRLPDDDILVPPQHQPINPEDEDDVVPDQHAAFGIQRATQAVRESAWKDLGLAALMHQGPGGSGGSAAAGGEGGQVPAGNSYAYYAYYYGYNGKGLRATGTSGNTSGLMSSNSGAGRNYGGSGRAFDGMPR